MTGQQWYDFIQMLPTSVFDRLQRHMAKHYACDCEWCDCQEPGWWGVNEMVDSIIELPKNLQRRAAGQLLDAAFAAQPLQAE